jgi:hypothetical protein
VTASRDDTISLRHYVAKREGLNDVPDPFWNKPITRQYVQLWASAPSASERRELQERVASLIREDIKASKAVGGDITPWTIQRRKGYASTEASLVPGDPIALRAEALCVYWAKLAEADRDVRAFRTKVLGAGELSDEEARRLIASPASAVMSPKVFERYEIPLAEHSAELEVTERSHPFEHPYKLRARLHVKWPAGGRTIEVNNKAPSLPEPMEICDGTKSVLIQPWSHSVLGELRILVSKLVERYPWEPTLAAWFVLTGEPPWVPPLTATASGPDQVKNYGTITIRAAHWLPVEAIGELYSDLKSRMGPSPTTSKRRLALFRFVAQRSSGIREHLVYGLDIPTWRSLIAAWNKEYPSGHDWHYRDLRNFRRDFVEASKALVGY